MGLELIKSKIHIINNDLDTSEDFINISSLVIPFSIIFRKYSAPDIHSEEEILPFRKRDPEFQEIFYSEFLIDL